MRIAQLYETPLLRGREVYLIGTGPSMAVFPLEYLQDKTCVLLNDAARLYPLGPVAFTNHRQWLDGMANPRITHRIVKARFKGDPQPERDDNHVAWDHPDWYCFSYREPPWDPVSHFDRATLFQEPNHYWNMKGGSVAIFAVQFALWAGARAVILVGCDCLALAKEHHSHQAVTQARLKQNGRIDPGYDAYAAGLMVLQHEARQRLGVPVLTLTPFCGLGREQQQYRKLRRNRTCT